MDPDADVTGTTDIERTSSRYAWIATALFVVAFFGVAFRYGWASASPTIDESWAAVIGWAWLHGLRWGVDLVFTYGPLGFLQPNAAYTPALFDAFLAGQAVLTLGYAFVFGYCFHCLRAVARIAFAIVVLAGVLLSADTLLLGASIVAAVALDRFVARSRDDRRVWAALAVVALVICATGLIKFSAFPPAVALAGVGAWLFARERRYAAAATWLLVWLAALLALWVFVGGQRIGDLPAYLCTSLASASGYGAAMGLEAPAVALALGTTALLAAFAAIAATIAGAWRDHGSRALVVCAHLALCLWIAWRASFTRADVWHVYFFFPLACCIVFALLALRTRVRAVVLVVCASLCVATSVAATLQWVREQPDIVEISRARLTASLPSTTRAKFDRHRAMLQRQFGLPTIRGIVGDARVDLFGCAQAFVLLNGFAYAPRPVIQSYAAYTETLRRMNEAYLLGPQAPPFVLIDSCAIDSHVPTGDDGLALLAILRAYQPAAVEKNLLLMRRVPTANPTPVPAPACPCTPLARGDWLDVPEGGATLMHVRYDLTLAGKLRGWFLSEPMLMLEAQAANGVTTSYRLPRHVARGGFLLSPMLGDTQSYLAWYFNEERLPIARVRIVAESPSQESLFAPAMEAGFAPIAIPDAAERGQKAPGR